MSHLRNESGYEPKRLKHARNVLEKILESNNLSSIPSNSFERLAGFALITVNKAGAIVSGEFGTGLFIGRLNYNNTIRRWTGPVLVKLSGAEIGLNVGMAKTDHFIIFYDDAAVLKFLRGESPKLSFDGSVEAPNNRSHESNVKQDISAWALTSKGLFVSASLEGKVLNMDDKKTRKYYGFDYSVDRILSGEIMPPHNADYDRIIQILEHRISNLNSQLPNINNNNTEFQPHIQSSSKNINDHKMNTNENLIQRQGDLLFDKTAQHDQSSKLNDRSRGNSSTSEVSITSDLSISPSLSRSISPDNQMEVIHAVNDRDENNLGFSGQRLNLPIGDRLNINDNYNEKYKRGIDNNISNDSGTTIEIASSSNSDLRTDRLNDTFPSSSSNRERNSNVSHGISEKLNEFISNNPLQRENERFDNTKDKLNLNARGNFEEHNDNKSHNKPQSETSWKRAIDINSSERQKSPSPAKSIPRLETENMQQYPSSNISNVSDHLPNMNKNEEYQRGYPLENAEKVIQQPYVKANETHQPSESENLKSSSNFKVEENQRNSPLQAVAGVAKKATEFVQNLPIFSHQNQKPEQIESNNLRNSEIKYQEQETSQTLPNEKTKQNSSLETAKGLLSGVKEKISEQSHLASEKTKQLIGNMRSTHEKESVKPNENLESTTISQKAHQLIENIKPTHKNESIENIKSTHKNESIENLESTTIPQKAHQLIENIKPSHKNESVENLESTTIPQKAHQLIENIKPSHKNESIENLESKPISGNFELEKKFIEQPLNQPLLVSNISPEKSNLIENEQVSSTVSNEQKPSILNTAKEKVIGLTGTVQQKMVEAKDVVVGQTQKLKESMPTHILPNVMQSKPSTNTSNETNNNISNTLPVSNETLPSHMYCNTLPNQEYTIPPDQSNIVTEKPIPLQEKESLLSKAKGKVAELKETVQQKIIGAKDIVTGQTQNNKESVPLNVPIDITPLKSSQESVAPLSQPTLFEGHEKSIPEVHTENNIKTEKKGPIVVGEKLTEEQNKPSLTEEVPSSTSQESRLQSAKNKIVELKDVAVEKGSNIVGMANTKTKELMGYLKPKNEQNEVKAPTIQSSGIQYVPEESLDKEKNQVNNTTSHTIPLLEYAKNKASELSGKVMEKGKEFIDNARDFVENEDVLKENNDKNTLIPNQNNLTSSITSDIHKNSEISLPNNNTSNQSLQSSLLPNNKDQIYNNTSNIIQPALLPNNNNNNNNQLYNNTLNSVQPNNENPFLFTTAPNPYETIQNNNLIGAIPNNNLIGVPVPNSNLIGVVSNNNLIGVIPTNNPYEVISSNNPYQTIPINNPYQTIPINNPYGVIPTNNPYGVIPNSNPFEQIPNVSYGIPNSGLFPNIQSNIMQQEHGNIISRKTETIQNTIPITGIDGQIQQPTITSSTTTYETINKQPNNNNNNNFIKKNLNDEQEG